jgi:DNA-directed RNA polymerase subunit RPC12/RpoP
MAQYLKFKCVFCGQSMECDPAHAGRQIKCPKCDHKIAIPPDPNSKAANPPAQTWVNDVPSPDVSVPTRYASPKEQKSPDKTK